MTAPRQRLLTRAFVLLTVADLAYFTAGGIAIYALPLYVTGPLGSGESQAGLAFGVFAVSALLLRPLAGRLADSWGRRPLLVGGALIAASALALTVWADNVPVVLALRLLLGAAEALFFVASFAALADLAPADRLGEALSYSSLGLYLGLALGPLLAERIVESAGFREAWLVAGALAALAAACAWGIGETRASTEVGPPAPLIHRGSVPVAVALFTSLFAIGAFLSLVSLHATEVGLTSTSLPLFCYGAVVVIGRIAFARVMDRLPALPLGAAALALTAAGLALSAMWSTPGGLLAGAALLALGVTFSTPALFAAIFATVPAAERGAASGTASVAMDLGLGGGPMVLGLVAQGRGIGTALMIGAVVALVGSLWTVAVNRARAT